MPDVAPTTTTHTPHLFLRTRLTYPTPAFGPHRCKTMAFSQFADWPFTAQPPHPPPNRARFLGFSVLPYTHDYLPVRPGPVWTTFAINVFYPTGPFFACWYRTWFAFTDLFERFAHIPFIFLCWTPFVRAHMRPTRPALPVPIGAFPVSSRHSLRAPFGRVADGTHRLFLSSYRKRTTRFCTFPPPRDSPPPTRTHGVRTLRLLQAPTDIYPTLLVTNVAYRSQKKKTGGSIRGVYCGLG